MILKHSLPIAAICVVFATATVTAGEPGIDRWGKNESFDAMTDKRIVSAGVATADGMILQFQCSGDRFGAVIAPFSPLVAFEFITMDDLSPVAWRIDSETAVTETWHVLPGRAGASYAVVSLDAADFAAAVMAGGQRLTFRVHGLTASVPLQGAGGYVAEAVSACDSPQP